MAEESDESLSIKLEFGTPSNYEIELISAIPKSFVTRNTSGDIQLSGIMAYLKGVGYPLENSMVYYYSNIGDIHVYVGNDPLPSTIYTPATELENGRLSLKCRETLVN